MKNQERIFIRNKFKDIVFLLISLVFVAGGYSLLEKNLMMGWLGIFFFSLIAVVFLIQLISNTSYLKLSEEGFEEKTLLKTKSFKWKDVSNFEIRSFRWNKSIHFNHNDKSGNKNWKSIISSYTIKTQDLLVLMRDYKKKS
jgi:hypothetical protein